MLKTVMNKRVKLDKIHQGIDWLIIVFIQENQHHKLCFSEGPWENYI
jgi:hypothetical protein